MTAPVIFRHRFGGWDEQDARRHVNPDGSKGGIVAVGADIGTRVNIAFSAEVASRVSIGNGVSIGTSVMIGARVIIDDRASVGHGASIGSDASIDDGASIGSGASIGYGAGIGKGARIGIGASIGYGVIIGNRASIGNGVRIEANDWWVTIGPLGSRRASLTAVQTKDGLRWWVGCKHNITTGRLCELVAATHGGTDHEADYLHCIAHVQANPARLRCEAARQAKSETAE